MAKTTQLAITGAGYNSIRATLPAHYFRIWEDGARTSAFEYQLPDDNYATTYVSKAGDLPIRESFGHGRRGIIARPPGYNAENVPLLGEIYIKIRVQGGGNATLNYFESENEL